MESNSKSAMRLRLVILGEPFNAAMIRAACPGWTERDYHIVLSDHAVGIGCSNELSERVSFGLYPLLRRPASEELRDSGCDLSLSPHYRQ
jgi:hypothetical protein